MRFLRMAVSGRGVLMRLFRMLMSGLVVPLPRDARQRYGALWLRYRDVLQLWCVYLWALVVLLTRLTTPARKSFNNCCVSHFHSTLLLRLLVQ